MDNMTIKEKVQKIAEASWRKMNNCSLTAGKDLGDLPEIRFTKLKGFYGLAFPDHFELDKTTIDNLSGEELDRFLRRLTIHELAHIAEYRINNKMSHGPIWHAFDHAGGGAGLDHGYILQEDADWEFEKKVGPAWAIMQLICFCAIYVILVYVTANLFKLKHNWLAIPILVISFFGNFTIDAACVKKDENMEMFCTIKFLIVVPLAVYLLFRAGILTFVK